MLSDEFEQKTERDMTGDDKTDKPPVDIKKLDPLGSLTDEQHAEADKRAQAKNDTDDADFTEKINKFKQRNKGKKPPTNG